MHVNPWNMHFSLTSLCLDLVNTSVSKFDHNISYVYVQNEILQKDAFIRITCPLIYVIKKKNPHEQSSAFNTTRNFINAIAQIKLEVHLKPVC